MFNNIVLEVTALVGFAAFVSLLINVLKFFGVVKDGTSDKWVAGFNLAGILALFTARLFIPDWNPLPVDNILLEIATVGGYILTYVIMIYGSRFTYGVVKNIPLIGKSFSQ